MGDPRQFLSAMPANAWRPPFESTTATRSTSSTQLKEKSDEGRQILQLHHQFWNLSPAQRQCFLNKADEPW